MPVVRPELAIINKYDLEAEQMDVKTAYWNGLSEEVMYTEIPEGLQCDKETNKKPKYVN